MATMQFDLVSPERRLASVQAGEVRLPGVDGDLTAMPGHAPVITTLRPGILKAIGPEGEQEFVVTGGFAEITGDACTVLAERGLSVSEMDQGVFDEMLADARAKHEAARATGNTGVMDAVVKLIADMVALGAHIGLDTEQANVPD